VTWSAAPVGWRSRRSGGRCCGHAARLQFLGGADDQRLELADGGHPSQGGAASGGQQHPQCLPLTPTPWGRQVVLAKSLAGGPDGVQRVALGAAAAGWPLGSGDLQDLLAVLLQEPRKASAEAARSFHRPAATARQLEQGEVQQPLVAGRVGAGGGPGEHAAEFGDGGGGQGVAVVVDADDAVDELCQHGHRGGLPWVGAAVVGVGLGGVTARHRHVGASSPLEPGGELAGVQLGQGTAGPSSRAMPVRTRR
jgi:hypothetical protein